MSTVTGCIHHWLVNPDGDVDGWRAPNLPVVRASSLAVPAATAA